MLKETWLVLRGVGTIGSVIGHLLSRAVWLRTRRLRHRLSPSPSISNSAIKEDERRNIIVIGASMAGHQAAKAIAEAILPGSPYRVIVIEPHDYFHFTWVLPRFCVVQGHEHKAFIPYGPGLRRIPESAMRWIQGRVVRVSNDSVRLSSGEEIPYEFVGVSTGGGAEHTWRT